jgi:conjugal transfer pilin signal peptidase TrbI
MIMELSKKKSTVIALMITIPTVMIFWGTASRICYSMTPSLPYRLFWVTPLRTGQEINVGEYVVFPSPKTYSQLAAVNFPDILKNTYLLFFSVKAIKQVKCKEGQTLAVQGKKFFCDGVFIGEAKEKTLSGLPLTAFEFNGVIPGGKMFVMGSHRDSYDSRYIGFIDRSAVKSTGTPLL